MWALRRASASHRVRVCFEGRFFPVNSAPSLSFCGGRAAELGSSHIVSEVFKRFYCLEHSRGHFQFSGHRSFVSQAGVEECGKEKNNMADGLSELVTPESSVACGGCMDDGELNSDSEQSDDDVLTKPASGYVGLVDTLMKAKEGQSSEFFKAVVTAPGLSFDSAFDNYVKDGKEINREEINLAMIKLQKRRMHGRALQLSEWLEKKKILEFDENDYASRLDLICKVKGMHKGESYVKSICIQDSVRGEYIYVTLLANYVSTNNVKKAEETFKKMREMDLPLTVRCCNQMLLLHVKTDSRKVADVLLLMEKENVKPNLATFRLLIQVKSRHRDIVGMEQVVEAMKSQGVEPDMYALSIIAKTYIDGGLKDKALKVLKEMEGNDLNKNRPACAYLLPLYASLGKADEVKRIWGVCESDFMRWECLSAIEAWGQLKQIDEAEHLFDKLLQTWNGFSPMQYTVMLRVYADNKMLAKGKALFKKMVEIGCRIGPYQWDVLVKLYAECEEIEKAESILQKAAERNQKVFKSSYMYLLNTYANKGDIHNAEKIFQMMRQAGHTYQLHPFQTLVKAYIKAKTPAYGMKERLKADNLLPSTSLSVLLAKIDPFKKTEVAAPLD